MTDERYFEEGSYYYKKTLKDRLTSFFSNSGTVIVIVIMIWAEFYGIYHASRKHDSGEIAFYIPPMAWYYAVEGVFWHNDFAGIDWDRQFEADIKVISTFVETCDTDDIELSTKRQQALVEFSTRISKYPNDKKYYLMSATILLCRYCISISKDMTDYYKSVYNHRNLQFDFSNTTINLRDEMSKIIELKQSLEGDKEKIIDNLKSIDLSDSNLMNYDDYVVYSSNSIEGMKKKFELLFYELFGRSEWEQFKRTNPDTL